MDQGENQDRTTKIIKALEGFGRKRLMPTRNVHLHRNDFNCVPNSMATIAKTLETKFIGKKPCEVYRDSLTGCKWVKMPWYLSLFHNPAKNLKFMAFDNDIIASATSSSEFIISKAKGSIETFAGSDIKKGSYNFRTNGIRHFWADIFPVVVYCKCIGS